MLSNEKRIDQDDKREQRNNNELEEHVNQLVRSNSLLRRKTDDNESTQPNKQTNKQNFIL